MFYQYGSGKKCIGESILMSKKKPNKAATLLGRKVYVH
jgi:hypothetical protein